MSTLGFWPWAALEPDRLALVDPAERRVSFGALHSACNRVANGLRAMGLRRGDGIAVILPNCVEFYEVFLAALQTGLYFTPINHFLTAREGAYVLADCEAKVLVSHSQFAETTHGVLAESGFEAGSCLAVGDVDGLRSYAQFKTQHSATPPADRSAGTSMVYTSGTTGNPKGVRSPLPAGAPEGPTAIRAAMGEMIGWKSGDGVYLLNGPLHHSAPIAFSTLALHLGHTVVMTDQWDAERVLALIDRYRVTNTQMVPIHFHRLVKLPEAVKRRHDVSSVRSILHSAAPCPVPVKREVIEWFGPVVYEYYGGTEGGVTHCNSQEWLGKPGTVGRPWPGVEISILDDEMNPLPATEVGAVYFKTPKGPPEYFKDPVKSESARHRDFFTLGEMGYLDEDGWLFLVDRKSDMLVSGGVNIYPAEIEAVLLQHPKVQDAAVFGVPNEEWGEEVKAVLEPVAAVEAGAPLAQEVLDFCQDKLARYKLPRSIEFIDEMPRGPNGKLYKRQLREPYWQGRQKKI